MTSALAPEGVGWAAGTLHSSLRSSIVLALGVWQVVMIATVLVSEEAAGERAPLVAAHLGLIGMALLVRSYRVPLWTFAMALNVMMLVDWSAAVSVHGSLALATAWMCNLAQMLPAMLMTGLQSRFYGTVIGLVVPIGLYAVQPDWLNTLVIASIVTGLAIRTIGRRAIPVLDRFARAVDDEAAAAERGRRAAEAARAASLDSAEQARTLHDTAVNTLAAVASGGGAIRDVEQVRARCHRDAATLQLLIDGFDTPAEQLSFGAIADGFDLVISRRGLDDDELLVLSDSVSADVTSGFVGAAREALTNVSKHAGTVEAEVAITVEEGQLCVAVTDRGVGFMGGLVPGRGLAESVVARAESVGIAAVVDSSVGQGTHVRLSYPLSGASLEQVPAAEFMDTIVGIQKRAGWLWVVGVVVVGVVIEMVNRFGILSPTYGMLAAVAVAAFVARRQEQSGRGLSVAAAGVVVAAVPAAFLLAFAGTDFGNGSVINWQCLGASAPLILLLDHGRTRVPLLYGLGGLVASTVVTTIVVAQESAEVATVVPVGACPPLLILGGWLIFHRTLEQVGRRASAEQEAAAAARLEAARREAAATSRERWRQAGLRDAVALLERLADGSLDPTDPRARRACADEESYLRQVTLLNPDLFRMGYWFARALAEARRRDLRLVVRAGSQDVSSESEASALGQLLLEAVAHVPAGSEMTVSFFSTRGELRLGLVGPRPLGASVAGADAPTGWSVSAQTFGESDFIEAHRPIASPLPLGGKLERAIDSGKAHAA